MLNPHLPVQRGKQLKRVTSRSQDPSWNNPHCRGWRREAWEGVEVSAELMDLGLGQAGQCRGRIQCSLRPPSPEL